MALTAKEQLDLNAIFLRLIVEAGYREETFSTPLGTEMGRIGTAATTSADGLMASADKNKLDRSFSAPQSLSGAGAANITARTTFLTATGIGDAVTLANGNFTGQRKSLTGTAGYTGGQTSVITPATFADGTTVTFSAPFDSVELEWTGATWKVVCLTGSAVVA